MNACDSSSATYCISLLLFQDTVLKYVLQGFSGMVFIRAVLAIIRMRLL